MKRNKTMILAATVAAIALLAAGGYAVSRKGGAEAAFAACQKGVVSGGMSSFGGAFTLTDENGARVTERDVFTKPSLLYFGYTFCPDICPTDSARNGEAAELLKQRGYDVRPVFVTVDPKRDTPQVVKDFTDAMSPDMLGLTGTPEEIAAINKLWRNYYKAHDDGTDPYYLVDHATSTFLVLPKQGTVDFFTREVSPEEMADRTACFIDAAGKV